MLFNSLEFLAFFSLVLPLYWLLKRDIGHQNAFLLCASYTFYASWDYRFLLLIWTSTLTDFWLGERIYRTDDTRKKAWMTLSVIFNLSFLGFFKYYGFFASSLLELGGRLGLNLELPILNIVLPVGISFYTFQSLSYTIDIYRGKLKPAPSLLGFAVFVAYFPHLVAGPIVRARDLLPQISEPRTTTSLQIREGLWLCLWGLFKKVYVADNLAEIVNHAFSRSETLTGGEALLALYCFAFQIYGDFSGYTDIARGVSKLMGIELCINFLFPYTVTNPSDFWKNWHISLSSWLREYLYVSIGGNRGGLLATCRNLFVTMVLGGLWHGAAWTFVLWGVYQGGILVIHRLILQYGPSLIIRRWRWAFVTLMFQITCYGWLIFRAENVGQILDFSFAMTGPYHWTALTHLELASLLLYVTPVLTLEWFQRKRNDLFFVLQLTPWLRASIYVSVGWLLLALGNFGGEQFIYFQF